MDKVDLKKVLGEHVMRKCRWVVEKFADDAAYARGESYEKNVIEGNVLLNTGIDEIWELVAGASANHFDNTNARLGVGNSSTAEQATDTDLIGGSTFYGTMEATYPLHTTQKITFKMVAASGDANFAWEEYVVKQNTSSICLNRKTSSQGTKSSGQTWTLTFEITLS